VNTNCGKYKAETDQRVGDAARTDGEADQDRGKVQNHPNCAIIIVHSVKKHTACILPCEWKRPLAKNPNREN